VKKHALLYFLLFPLTTCVLSQPCNVSLDSLKGQYVGACKNGKAQGIGTATGIDSYTGNFKNGYPDGQGKYTWQNGSWYEGTWERGLFNGQGTYSGLDSGNTTGFRILSGFWKKGKYIGKYEKPFTVLPLTNNISDVSVRKLNKTESQITINVKTITAGASSNSAIHLPKAQLVNIQLIEGRFEQRIDDETSSLMANKYTFRKVTFPFGAIFTFETIGQAKLPSERLELNFLEDCNCYVQVAIDN
jgi:hypothetical protein